MATVSIKPKVAVKRTAKAINPKTAAVKREMPSLGKPSTLMKANQESRSVFLTDDQRRWQALQWEQFVADFALTPSDEMTKEERNQVNYGRALLRDEREARKLASIKDLEKAAKTPIAKQDKAERIIETFQESDSLEQRVKILADSKTAAAIEKDAETQSKDQRIQQGRELMAAVAEKNEPNPMNRLWEEAERLAKAGMKETWNELSFMVRTMVIYSFNQFKETGEFHRPEKLMQIFWPTLTTESKSQFAVVRRQEMRKRINDYLERKKQDPHPGFDLKSESYRITLAGIRLAETLERYVLNPLHAGTEQFVEEELLAKDVQKATFEYYVAYLPIPREEIKPGPFDTVDPDFLTYVKLIQDYDIEFGHLLHREIL